MIPEMKANYLILLVVVCSGMIACTREPAPQKPAGIVLQFDPYVSQSPETRQTIFGDASGRMPNRSSYGLFICDHHTGGSNPYSEYALRYNNIRAYRDLSGIWSYNYYGYTDGFPVLYMIPKDENRDEVTDINADILAYAPWQETVTTPESIPFNIEQAVDVMYAAENTDPVINKNIDPATDSRITYGSDGFRHLDVPLTFTHALSLLVFEFRLRNDYYNHPMGNSEANSYALDYIRVIRKEGGHPLYVSGMMNAVTGGTLSGLVPVMDNVMMLTGRLLEKHYSERALSVYPAPNQPEPACAYILQVPSQAGETYTNGDYTFEFGFSGQEFPVTFTLLEDHLKHQGEDAFHGFQPGYKYTFHFGIDNYVHFEGVTIAEWETVEIPFQTEI